MAAPLHYLTKKDVPFAWTEECEFTFSQLKQFLIEAPILCYPQFGSDESFLLETDASGIGLGAILSQKQSDGEYHPIAYASRSLQPSEKNYGISELETLALVWAVKYFRTYILGHPCTVLTDHAACLSLLNTQLNIHIVKALHNTNSIQAADIIRICTILFPRLSFATYICIGLACCLLWSL